MTGVVFCSEKSLADPQDSFKMGAGCQKDRGTNGGLELPPTSNLWRGENKLEIVNDQWPIT